MSDHVWTGPKLKTRSPELRIGRELALKAMYSIDQGSFEPPVAWHRCLDAFFAEELALLTKGEPSTFTQVSESSAETIEVAQDIARRMLDLLWKERSTIDAIIRSSSKRWRLNRMQPIERNLLRIGTFELLKGLTPARDVIYDCVELGKAYGDTPTPGFVNGILDQICQDNQIQL